MNAAILNIVARMKDAWDGDPWFGRSVSTLLGEADESIAFERPNGQHSLLDLLWHMITWKEFVISRLEPDGQPLSYFETFDWRPLDHEDKTLWRSGLERIDRLQKVLMDLVSKQEDGLLEKTVPEKSYRFGHLLSGIVEHDVYHAGQIAYIVKMLKDRK